MWIRYSSASGGPSAYPLRSWGKVARKADERDLGPSMKPAVNGDRAHLADGELEPQAGVAQPRIATASPPLADYRFLSTSGATSRFPPAGGSEGCGPPRPASRAGSPP